jgi:hypothetical protein
VNRENIKKVRDLIASLPPERLDMSQLFSRDDRVDWDYWRNNPRKFKEDCCTAACIAGWTLVRLASSQQRRCGADARDAGQLLGLETEEADELFLPEGYEQGGRYDRADAVRVLDHLLETGQVDWSIIDQPEGA